MSDFAHHLFGSILAFIGQGQLKLVVSKFEALLTEFLVALLTVTTLERLEPLVARPDGAAPSPQNHRVVGEKQLFPVFLALKVAKVVLDSGDWKEVVHNAICIEACCTLWKPAVLDLIVRPVQLCKCFFVHGHPECP